jgi:hypothetical protein
MKGLTTGRPPMERRAACRNERKKGQESRHTHRSRGKCGVLRAEALAQSTPGHSLRNRNFSQSIEAAGVETCEDNPSQWQGDGKMRASLSRATRLCRCVQTPYATQAFQFGCASRRWKRKNGCRYALGQVSHKSLRTYPLHTCTADTSANSCFNSSDQRVSHVI